MIVNENKNCKCEYEECVRHGNCIECAKHHKESNTLPYCRRKPTNSGMDSTTEVATLLGIYIDH